MASKILTVTEQIYRELRDEILDHRIPPGEKLTIKMLHERYGVSSSPIREALAHLQQDGLINYKPNIGMRVVEMTPKDMEELFTLMAELDAIAVRFAMKSERRDEMLEKLRKLRDEGNEFVENDIDGYLGVSEDFHLLFYEYADNSRLADAAGKIRMQFSLFSRVYQKEPHNQKEIHEQHQAVINAVLNGDVEEASLLMRQHVQSSRCKALHVIQNENEQ